MHGLYLEGAGWNKKEMRLCESSPKVLSIIIPVVHLYAVTNYTKDAKAYYCPIYKKPCRTDLTFITSIALQTVKPPEHWILRGVAALCDIK